MMTSSSSFPNKFLAMFHISLGLGSARIRRQRCEDLHYVYNKIDGKKYCKAAGAVSLPNEKTPN
jgi:hypothetical protein